MNGTSRKYPGYCVKKKPGPSGIQGENEQPIGKKEDVGVPEVLQTIAPTRHKGVK